MKILLVVCALIAVLGVSIAGCAADTDSRDIKRSIRNFWAAYNHESYAECLENVTEYPGEDGTLYNLAVSRTLTGKIELKNMENITVDEANATANVTTVVLGEEKNSTIQLKKIEDKWKITWSSLNNPIS
jgi:hypothetical protein